jgi:hypothetical protein
MSHSTVCQPRLASPNLSSRIFVLPCVNFGVPFPLRWLT